VSTFGQMPFIFDMAGIEKRDEVFVPLQQKVVFAVGDIKKLKFAVQGGRIL
jgi:hypothetical protein